MGKLPALTILTATVMKIESCSGINMAQLGS